MIFLLWKAWRRFACLWVAGELTQPRRPRYASGMFRVRFARFVAVVLVAASYGCAEPVLHKAGDATFPPRPKGCLLAVLATHPGPEYVEVAQITIEGDRSFGAGTYRDPQEFADVVHDRVCASGGDTLITEVNGFGIITRGIVLRKVASPARDTGAPATLAPAAAGACEPICSPGFRCNAGTCVPECNPSCTDGEVCGTDRLCHAKQ